MSFNGNEGEQITLHDASIWTASYRNGGGSNGVNAHFFGVEKLKLILAQKDCVGVRMYYAKDDTGKPALVLVGVDKNENDLSNGVILDRSVPCPSYCGTPNPLNS
ncbi:MAG: hypothetical protein H0U95_16695 [Bacteroidetes bacterium]|nr:hypothetical protein [Bacteroidota bacterium]